VLLVWITSRGDLLGKLAKAREGEGLPGEMAAHEHSHGALYICPNRWKRQGCHFLKGPGANEPSAYAPDRLTHIENPGENELPHYRTRIMILPDKNCQVAVSSNAR
jgi:hypothetical protein